MYLYIEKNPFQSIHFQIDASSTGELFFVYFAPMAAVFMVRPSIGLYTYKICYKQNKN